MAVVLYAGLPGSGKSYSVVAHQVLPAVESGRVVVTNLPLEMEPLQRFYPGCDIRLVDFSDEDFDWLGVPGGALVIIDEAADIWPSGIKQNRVPESQLKFLRMHRHAVGEDGRTQEVVLVSQDSTLLGSCIRKLIDTTFVTVKADAVGASKRFVVDIYKGAPSVDKLPVKRRLRQMIGKYKPEVYQYYKSHTRSVGNVAGLEERVDKRANVLRSWLFTFGLPASLVVSVFSAWLFFHSIHSFIRPTDRPDPEVSAVDRPRIPVPGPESLSRVVPAASASVRSGSVEPVSARSGVAPLSSSWRLVGVLSTGDGGIALLRSAGGLRRLPVSACSVDSVNQWTCVVDGERATVYSGSASNMYSAAVSMGTAGAGDSVQSVASGAVQ